MYMVSMVLAPKRPNGKNMNLPSEQPQSALSARLATLDEQSCQAIPRTFFWRWTNLIVAHEVSQVHWPRRSAFFPSRWTLHNISAPRDTRKRESARIDPCGWNSLRLANTFSPLSWKWSSTLKWLSFGKGFHD